MRLTQSIKGELGDVQALWKWIKVGILALFLLSLSIVLAAVL